MKALSLAEIEQGLLDIPEWTLEEGRLVRVWTFAEFVQAMDFVNKVADVAEKEGHHPDIDMRYSRVTLGLTTHDVGGITERDLGMAKRLNGLLEG